MFRPALGITATALLALTTPAIAQTDADDLKAFPPAESGMSRHVIMLPEQSDESEFLVEILPGKMLDVDCNRVMISARVTTETVEGWGYSYLVVDNVSQPATTMMACPDDAKENRFVAINLGADALQRYNSKLPLVVYTPEELAVKYRVWRADAEISDAKVE